MTYNKRRMTIGELKPFVAFYQSQLPDWRLVRRDTLIRESGPVLQGITFERLSYGAYRPIGYIRILVAPEKGWCFALPQLLNVKVRQVEPRAHELMRDKVLTAMRAEFDPSLDRPLDSEQVLTLYEQKAVPSSPQAYSLAALNAYLGHALRCLEWCSRFTELVNENGLDWAECDYRRQAFLDQLQQWVKDGDAKHRLDRVLDEERRIFKIT